MTSLLNFITDLWRGPLVVPRAVDLQRISVDADGKRKTKWADENSRRNADADYLCVERLRESARKGETFAVCPNISEQLVVQLRVDFVVTDLPRLGVDYNYDNDDWFKIDWSKK